jgi:protein-tyrosine phosphatase
MTAAPAPPQIATLPNLRDVGGHTTAGGGRVRSGLLFRSTDLARLDDEGTAALVSLGIRSVFDLRTVAERDQGPDRVPPGATHVVMDVLRDSAGLTPAGMGAVLANPEAAERALGGGRAERLFIDAYREFVELPGARAAYGRLFLELARPERRPGLVHCTTGKDRTGWAVAVLLLALGVPEPVVMEEYLLSGPAIAALFAPHLAEFAGRGGNPDLVRPLLEVRPEYLGAGLAAMRAGYGTVEAYLAEGLGVDEQVRAALRQAFVEPG